jgi:hypothetical protein
MTQCEKSELEKNKLALEIKVIDRNGVEYTEKNIICILTDYYLRFASANSDKLLILMEDIKSINLLKTSVVNVIIIHLENNSILIIQPYIENNSPIHNKAFFDILFDSIEKINERMFKFYKWIDTNFKKFIKENEKSISLNTYERYHYHLNQYKHLTLLKIVIENTQDIKNIEE